MKPLPVILALALVSSVAITPAPSYTQTEDPHFESQEEEDDEPVPRVARLSFIQGDVSFLRAGVSEWADAVENLPLLTGDQLYIGKEGRAELQLGRGNYIRLSEKTALTIADLSHTTAQFEITEGIAIIRLERFGTAFSRFEIDTPNAALVLEQDGMYRVNVRGKEESEMVVRQGAAEVATLDGSFKVREGQRLLIDTSSEGRLEIAADDSRDDWDRWSFERDDTINNVVVASSPDYVTTQETTSHCFYGAAELSRYGYWTNIASYGYCWIPRVSSGWAPYRVGQWLWIPRVGWSWLSHEPWGWAPYHYGRWAQLPSIGWAWVPGIRSHYRYGHSYYQWRPALVRFYYTRTPRGNYIAWCPLNPGQRWRRHDRDRRDNNRRNNNRRERDHSRYPTRTASQRPDPTDRPGRSDRRGLTVVPASGFAKLDRFRMPQAADPEITRSIDRDATRGLPDLAPEQAAAPRKGDGKPRYVATPPPDILTRPVVTRNRPSDSQAESFAPRERRLVAPRKFKGVVSAESPMINKSNGAGELTGRRSKSDEGRQDSVDREGRNPGSLKRAQQQQDETKEDRRQKRVVNQDGGGEKKGSESQGSDSTQDGSNTRSPRIKNRVKLERNSGPTNTDEETGNEERPRQKERKFDRPKADDNSQQGHPRSDETRSKRDRVESRGSGAETTKEQPRARRSGEQSENSNPRNEVREQRRQQVHEDKPAARPERQEQRQQKEERRQERRKGNK